MAEVAGFDVLIKLANTVVAGQQGATLNVSRDFADISTKDDADWKHWLPLLREWSIDLDAAVITTTTYNIETILEAFTSGNAVTVELLHDTTKIAEGSAYVRDFKLGAPRNDAATFSCTLQGVGELEFFPLS